MKKDVKIKKTPKLFEANLDFDDYNTLKAAPKLKVTKLPPQTKNNVPVSSSSVKKSSYKKKEKKPVNETKLLSVSMKVSLASSLKSKARSYDMELWKFIDYIIMNFDVNSTKSYGVNERSKILVKNEDNAITNITIRTTPRAIERLINLSKEYGFTRSKILSLILENA